MGFTYIHYYTTTETAAHILFRLIEIMCTSVYKVSRRKVLHYHLLTVTTDCWH